MASRAVLVGTWDYEHFHPRPAARNSLERMRALLVGDLCGWPADRVTVIGNRATPGDLYDELIKLYSDADSVALFYYVGVVQPDHQSRLCLCLTGSRHDVNRRASTSLRFGDVRDALSTCAARTKIVMLDCCFEVFKPRPQGWDSAANVLDMARGSGAYTMVASSIGRPETDGERPQSYFTKYFADVVESGIGRDPESMRLNHIFAKTRTRLLREYRPEPAHTARHPAGRIVFARNAAVVDPEERLDSLARHPVAAQVEQVVALRAAGQQDAADDLAGVLGQGTADDVLLAVDLLRAKEQDEPMRTVLRSAGHSNDVVGLVRLLAEEERTDDIREIALATRRLARWRRRRLARQFRDSTVPETTWRPLFKVSLRDRLRRDR